MDIATMKEQQKKENLTRAIEKRDMNRKKYKFNFFTYTEHKRNKKEQKLYLLLNERQKRDIKLMCDVLGLDIDFFNYWFNKNHRLYMSNIEPINWVILKAPDDGIEPEGRIRIKNIDEICIMINGIEYRKNEIKEVEAIKEVDPIKAVEPIKKVEPIIEPRLN